MSLHGRELTAAGLVAGLTALALLVLWAPAGWGPGVLVALADIVAGLALTGVLLAAMRARLNVVAAARPRDDADVVTFTGAVLVGVIFLVFLVVYAGAVTHALVAKHGVITAFPADLTRLGALLFWFGEAMRGAVFDVFDVFPVRFGAPGFDAAAHWGLGAGVVVFRLIASYAMWSLVFSVAARRLIKG